MSEFSYDRDYKLRVIVDRDLFPGQQIAQALHAITEFIFEYPEIASQWHILSNSIVVMSASSSDISKLVEKCSDQVSYSIFREPDMNNKLTAICLEPTKIARRLTANFPLALRECSLAV